MSVSIFVILTGWATPKDEYPMPVADLLVDGASRHEILFFISWMATRAIIRFI